VARGAYLARQRGVYTLSVDTRLEEHHETIAWRVVSCELVPLEQHAQRAHSSATHRMSSRCWTAPLVASLKNL